MEGHNDRYDSECRTMSFLQLATPLTWYVAIWEHLEEGTLDFPHQILRQQCPPILLEGKPGGRAGDHGSTNRRQVR